MACYSNPATLYADGFQITSEEGEHQGCPCGPLFFAVTALDLCKLAAAAPECWTHWYLDDGYIAGPRSTVNDLLPRLEHAAGLIGLSLNRQKSALILTHDLPMPTEFFQFIPRVGPEKCATILGSPIGPPEQCRQWVEDHVLTPYKRALSRLEALGDPRAASLILRQCLSACKVMWILRTADPSTALWTAQQASPCLRGAWDTILGATTQDAQWSLTSLPIRLGGAGLNDPLACAEAAIVSSWLSAATQDPATACGQPPDGLIEVIQTLVTKAPQLGGPLAQALTANGTAAAKVHHLLPQWCSQSSWTDEITQGATVIFDTEAQERLRSLRKLQTAANAGLWLTAAPHSTSSPTFSAREWQLLLQFRTGIPITQPNPTCRACRQTMDTHGDHSLACHASGMYRRHNRVRDALFHLAKEAGWDPELEVSLPLPINAPHTPILPARATRPADILMRHGGILPHAVDVTVSHPLRISASQAAREEAHSSAALAEKAKDQVSGPACNAVGWGFTPAGFETTGGMGPGALRLVRKLYKAIAMKSGTPTSSTAAMVSCAISLALAKGRGEMLAASIPA